MVEIHLFSNFSGLQT